MSLTPEQVTAIFDEIDEWDRVVSATLKWRNPPVGDHSIACPFCREPMEVLVRTARETWSGHEPPCVQFYCKQCKQGGEYEREVA